MKKIVHSIILTLALVLSSAVCYAQPISSVELINRAKEYDGKIVVFSGEAIGDVMLRGDYAWANINDGDNAIGAWLPAELAKEIRLTGSYKQKGDRVEVTGVFHRACPEHGGDLDIHGQALRKISAGRLLNHRLNTGKRNMAVVLAGALCLILILVRFIKK